MKRKTGSSKKCATPSCDNTVHSARLCANCYSGTYYWMKKGVKAAMERRHKLQIYQERIDGIQPANVVHLHERSRRRRAA